MNESSSAVASLLAHGKSIAIHHRPLGAVLAFSGEMGRRLDGLIGLGHLAQDINSR